MLLFADAYVPYWWSARAKRREVRPPRNLPTISPPEESRAICPNLATTSRDLPRPPATSRDLPRPPATSRDLPRPPATSRDLPSGGAREQQAPASGRRPRRAGARSPAHSTCSQHLFTAPVHSSRCGRDAAPPHTLHRAACRTAGARAGGRGRRAASAAAAGGRGVRHDGGGAVAGAKERNE